MFKLAYSIASYLSFLAVYTYFAFFSDGIAVPKTVDGGTYGSVAAAIAVNVGLVLLFGLQHSVMARPAFKRVLMRMIPPSVERATFVLASSVVLALLMALWRPMPAALWHVESPVAAGALWVVNALGWLGVPACSLLIDHFDLFGVKPAFHAFRRSTFERKGFVTPVLYRYVRHPMMTAFLVALWVTPQMTVGHAVLAVGMSAYIWVGVHFEERALARELGAAYVRYQKSTPRFLPWRGGNVETAEGAASDAAPRSV